MRFSVILLTSLVICFSGCNAPRAVREAEAVVAQADSLWYAGQMYGVDAGDSAMLAQAYATLDKYAAFYSFVQYTSPLCTSYAHACYHYGRLLRTKEDPVAAMQVFLNATHSRTHDYHILGRVYNNIGSICHSASEFELSYDMFERSADMYLRENDTLSYYFCLNDMALELAEQGKKDSCVSLLQQIYRSQIKDSILLAFCEHSQAQAYLKCSQYDSAIICANKSREYLPYLPATILQLAQAFSFMGKKDSATYYAQIVLSISNSLFDINNALYILTNDDKGKNIQSVRATAAKRSDTQKLLEIRQGKLSQAVQLLEQDISRKPDLKWPIAIIGTLFAISCIISLYVYQKRKKQALLMQKIVVLEQTANTIQEQKDELAKRYQINHKQIEDEINSRCTMLRTTESIKKTLAWKNYNKMCNIVDQRFYFLASKLRDNHFLRETEVRLCILTLLNCEYDQIAELLYHAPTSIGTLKMRVAKKLGTTAKDLRQYLIDNECVN